MRSIDLAENARTIAIPVRVSLEHSDGIQRSNRPNRRIFPAMNRVAGVGGKGPWILVVPPVD